MYESIIQSSLRRIQKVCRENIKSNIYLNMVSILWPNQLKERDKEIENRTLFIHMDYRYDSKDVKVITDTIKDFYNHE